MSAGNDSTRHIIQSLLVNVAIAIVKTVAAVLTKSGSMLAEALHSFSDCGNQILLLVGAKQAKRPADESHPLGYGRAVYFWSFLVALLLFLGGGVFSIYEGVHKLGHPEPVERVAIGLVILGISFALEGAATISNIKELNRRRGKVAFFQYLKDTKDVDLVVVFGENAAAVLGLFFAFAALALAAATGDGRWDAAGGLAIGLVLVGVAAFLGKEVSSLLLGEAGDPEIHDAVRDIVANTDELSRVLHLISVQQGPGEVMLSVKIAFAESMSIESVCETINAFEKKLRDRRPEVRWIFVEPDIPRS